MIRPTQIYESHTHRQFYSSCYFLLPVYILPGSMSHFLEQAKFGDYSAQFDEAAGFAGMPETIVPRATPAGAEKPNALLPAPEALEPEPKKGLLGKMKGWFQRSNPDCPGLAPTAADFNRMPSKDLASSAF